MMETETIRHPIRMPQVARQDSVQEVVLSVGPYTLRGTLQLCPAPRGVVVFANGSGSGRHIPRNRFLSTVFTEAGFATLLMDLLTEREAEERRKAFDVELLAGRLSLAVTHVMKEPVLADLPVGIFGASMGCAAALVVAASRPECISAIVARGGRPDLAWSDLPSVQAPTLLIVGGADESVLAWNRDAMTQLNCTKELAVVSNATHLFEEPGSLEQVARQARTWFTQHLEMRLPCAAGAAT